MTWDAVQNEFGSTESIFIAFGKEGKNIFNKEALSQLWDVTRALEKIKEIEKVKKMILRINDFMIGMFRGVGIKLIDFKLEFGRLKANGKNEIILADEISPDNCRLWQVGTDEKMDKDRFRRDLGGLTDAYREIARRLGIAIPGTG